VSVVHVKAHVTQEAGWQDQGGVLESAVLAFMGEREFVNIFEERAAPVAPLLSSDHV